MVRAGSRALSIFTNALDARVLYAHADGPLTPRDLEEAFGWAPQSSLRATVSRLCELGALARIGEGSVGAPTELTAAGRALLPIAQALEQWFGSAPGGSIPLDDPAAQGIVRVLIAGWDSTVIRALAERPRTLIELSGEISALSYPALKRRLAKLRSTHLIAPIEHDGGMAYVASDWLRNAVVPLILAIRWERGHDVESMTRVDIEAAFLLALPLPELPVRSAGSCALAVLASEERTRAKRDVAGVVVEVKRGKVVSYNVGATAPTWALGTVDAWLSALVDGERDTLRFGGATPHLATNIVKALHATLFPA